jgi:hemin uptake protein HemP
MCYNLFNMGNKATKKSAKNSEAIHYSDEYAIIIVTSQTFLGAINKQYYVNHDGDLYQITKYDSHSGWIHLNVNNKLFFLKIKNDSLPPSLNLFTKHYADISKKMNASRIGFYPSFESFVNEKYEDYYVHEKFNKDPIKTTLLSDYINK